VRIAVDLPSIAPGGRLEHALLGLADRGHLLLRSGTAPAGSALAGRGAPGGRGPVRREADVAVGGPRARGALLLAALSQASAVVLGLEADARRRWGVLERWGFARVAGAGLLAEEEVEAFLALADDAERERLALWPREREAGPASTHPDTDVLERACERALARRTAGPGRAALFVDRDGTLIEERDHLSDPEGVSLLPGVAEALREARAQGHPVVVVSNQAGVGRGLFPETRVHEVMARLRQVLREQGVELDAVRHCPHAPEAGCDCRKPATRLLREAADDLRLSLAASVMIGDKWIDVEAGRAVGGSGVLVRTGHGATEAALERPPGTAAADAVVDDLPAAVRWALTGAGGGEPQRSGVSASS